MSFALRMPRHLPKAELIKVVIFCLVAGLVSLTIYNTLAGGSGAGARHYDAVFTDASGVRVGDDVRVAGVKVGRVEGTSLTSAGTAAVTFSLERGIPITSTTDIHIRFANLIGQRYLELVRGAAEGSPLAEGATIPVSRTEPAIDLTLLFNDLQPVLTTFKAGELNPFFDQLIHVLQGEGGTVVGLLQNAATLSKHLNGSDAVFGRVVTNMNLLLRSTTSHRGEIHQLIRGLTTLVHGVASRRKDIFTSVDAVSRFLRLTTGLVHRSAPYISTDLQGLQALSGSLDHNRQTFLHALRSGNTVMWLTSHIMGYGGWWNLYVCNIRYHGLVSLSYRGPHSNRCR
ncbi:MAG TPA: MlaD family protein [Nocardioides sp.]|nr:MlaD family protein [Nocardioides sp.]